MTPESSKRLLAYTPMLHARLFNEKAKFRDNHFQPLRRSLPAPDSAPETHEAEALYLDGRPELDRPLTVQFCANDPEEFLNAAKYVAPFCDAVDLNLGCPQGIARKGKYGAFLQEDQELIYRLVNRLHRELPVPVTAKIRILDTREATLAYARRVLDAGASILTVHGRRREQKGHNTGLADWGVLRWLRGQLGEEVVLFANGNILQRGDVERCLEETGADGVMSAEGNLYDPGIFAEAPGLGEEGREYWRAGDGEGGWRCDAVYRRYLEIIYKHVLEVKGPERRPLYIPSDPLGDETLESGGKEEEGPPRKKQKKEKSDKTTSPNLLAMQAHSFHLLRALVSKHHNVRDALARCRAGDIEAFESVLQMVEKVCREGIREYAETSGRSWEEELQRDERLKAVKKDEKVDAKVDEADKDGEESKDAVEDDERYESSLEAVRRCKRPWWVVQPYVRPLPKEALAKGSMTLSKKDKAKLGKDAAVPHGHTEAERSGSGKEFEVPKEGLVCG